MGKYCCRCKIEQAPERHHNSYCNPCRSIMRKAATVKAREEKGLPERGFFKTHCCDCKAVKEDDRQAYCNKCRAVRNKAWNLKSGRVKKNLTGLCPCGAERGPKQKYYCLPCKARISREWRAAHKVPTRPQEVLELEKKARDAYQEIKRSVRKATYYYIKTGRLVRQPCEKCNTTDKVEAHHDDYTKPMDVRWLCRKHHLEHHEGEKKGSSKIKDTL